MTQIAMCVERAASRGKEIQSVHFIQSNDVFVNNFIDLKFEGTALRVCV